MKEIEIFLALLGQQSGDCGMLLDIIFHAATNKGLRRKLDGCKLAYTLMDKILSGVLVIDEALGKLLWLLCRPGRHMCHLLHLHVF